MGMSTGGNFFFFNFGVLWNNTWGPRGGNNFGRMGYEKGISSVHKEGAGVCLFRMVNDVYGTIPRTCMRQMV